MLTLNRAVLDAVPDPIFLSKDGKVVSGNTVAADYAGIHIKDFRGMDEDKVLVRAENAPDRGAYTTCLKGGEEVIMDEIVTTVTDRDGKELGRLVVARDVPRSYNVKPRPPTPQYDPRVVRDHNAAQELVGLPSPFRAH